MYIQRGSVTSDLIGTYTWNSKLRDHEPRRQKDGQQSYEVQLLNLTMHILDSIIMDCCGLYNTHSMSLFSINTTARLLSLATPFIGERVPMVAV